MNSHLSKVTRKGLMIAILAIAAGLGAGVAGRVKPVDGACETGETASHRPSVKRCSW